MSYTEKFCLKWDDFKDNIKLSFKELKENENFADITLVCENNQLIKAHRVILASSSPILKDIILNIKESNNLFLYMRGIDAKNMSYLINFIYNGEVNIYQEELNDFLTLADEFKLNGLAEDNSKDKPENDISAYSKDIEVNSLSQFETTNLKHESSHRSSYKHETTINAKIVISY